MVLYKRKPVEFVPHPEKIETLPDNTIWEIKETAEIFFFYDEYLNRRDFYLRKVFTCESTGRSGIDFFSALESEQNRNQELSTSFPVALRRPVLKHVQFSVVSRLEQLVNEVHDLFKNDFYPKEHVICIKENGDRVMGLVREKASFPEERAFDGMIIIRPAYSKYTVSLKSDNDQSGSYAVFETGMVARERKNFSKVLLRDFLKSSLTKEAWHGAPWIVKEHLAKEFDLPLEVPYHLQQSTKLAEKKILAQQKKAQMEYQRQQAEQSMFTITDFRQFPYMRKTGHGPIPPGAAMANMPWHSKNGKKDGSQGFVYYENLPSGIDGPFPHHYMPTPPPQIKYPIDDLDVPPKEGELTRPSFRLFTDLPCAGAEIDDDMGAGRYRPESIGSLLEVWNTLNVHNEVYVLDSFTLDDFAQALRFSSGEVDCELLAEVHCSVLKQFVDENGKLMVDLPNFDDSDEEDSEEEGSDDEKEEEEVEPEPTPRNRRTTRSSTKAQIQAEKAKEKSPTPIDPLAHKGEEFREIFSWEENCKDREFANNNWQAILAGLLDRISLFDGMTEKCNKILCKLLPPNVEPTVRTVQEEYTNLDVNDRLDALQLIVMLSLSTKALRDHLDRMTAEMTDLRKKKIEHQRLKKDLYDRLQELDAERRTLQAEIAPEESIEEPKQEVDSDMTIPEVNEHSLTDSEDAAPRLRRGAERVIERKRKRDEVEVKVKEKKAKAATTKLSKAEIKLRKLETDIEAKKNEIRECEDAVQDVNNDLRETDCQRTRCLGRDRFCNRYYWFERNGMPFSGVPETSTAHYGYANGRLWIQGPDDMEREGFLELNKEDQERYKDKFGVTVLERVQTEEGDTHLHNANDWGYFDDAESVDNLIAWLDDRGIREKALRKELQGWRDTMVEYMDNLRSHLGDALDDSGAPVPTTRVSTRTKTYVNLEATKWVCLKWHNSMAVEEIGMRHSDGIRKRRRDAKRGSAVVADKKGKGGSRKR